MGAKVELLSPVGNFECLEAVLGAGADAVYCGGKLFGARAYAGNFDTEELKTAIREVHVLGKKLYLTVNTLFKNKELYGELYDYMAPLYEEGLDAVLVQDFGVVSFLKKYFPELPIHASTQMTITGVNGMGLMESLGISRIVAARELSLEEIRKMHQNYSIEIEAFIHGALCCSYSGRCLMSSLIGGRSGNRGRCAQPCRLPYERMPWESGREDTAMASREDRGRKTGRSGKNIKKSPDTPLSLKDMNTIRILPEIIEAGVCSLKIEGRMKSKEYAAGVTRIYRKYLDRILLPGFDKNHYHVDPEDQLKLNELFSRGGSCTGYYKDYHGKFMVDLKGDKKTGEVKTVFQDPKTEINGRLEIRSGEPVRLKVECMAGDALVTAEGTGSIPLKASVKPVAREDVLSKMERLGNTLFSWKNLEIELEDGLFLPMKQLNELRRETVDDLCLRIAGRYRRKLPEGINEDARESFQKPSEAVPWDCQSAGKNQSSLAIYASCEDGDTALLLLRSAVTESKDPLISGLYVPLRILDDVLEEKRKLQALQRPAALPDIFVSLPSITRRCPENAASVLRECLKKGASGFLVKDPEMLSVILRSGLAGFAIADASLYTWNDEAVSFLRRLGILRNTVPLELNEGEIRRRDNRDSEMLVYGYLPMMVSAQCVSDNCRGRRERFLLKDRYGKRFPVQCECAPWKGEDTEKNSCCYNIIYNSLPFGLLEEAERVRECQIRSVRLAFTIEEPKEALGILKLYRSRYLQNTPGELYTSEGSGNTASPESIGEITKGHFKRGAL